ncbi:unnamed protein product [Lactuca saligna]|uniref:F-box domain-containing protein n=1 Tax=Lactuca saligna TaxID=75948 RepID=A0AA35VES0_LACSI|nr:unnamed protein product [Lactuca saligna]
MLECKMKSEQQQGESSHQELKTSNNYGSVMEDEDDTTGVSLRCLSLYTRGGGGCKVGAATTDDFAQLGKVPKPVCGTHDTSIDCFSYGVERFWKRNYTKKNNFEAQNNAMHVFLPDDILEMCLMRLPLTSLMNTRLVCKKWRSLTTTPRFLQMRKDGFYPSPWLFLFGTVKNGYCSREIYAFDVSFKKWHKIETEVLNGRFLFSVATVHDTVYIIGGCSSRKTHRGVLVFNPLMKSFHKVASMRHARSKPVLGVYEVNSDRLTIKSQTRTRTRTLTQTQTRFLIIAVGGVGSFDEPLDSCEIYDSSSNKWTEIQRVPVDFGIICSAVVCNGIFYVYSESDKLAAYDIKHGFWVRVPTNPVPPRVHEYSPKLVSCGGERLFMVAVSWCEGDGEIGRRNKAVRKLWELDLVCLSWNQVLMHPDAPMDWNAVFVGDKNLIFGVEMFKIFGQVLEFVTICDVSDPNMDWVHVSKNEVARDMDVSSCVMKSMAVVHL